MFEVNLFWRGTFPYFDFEFRLSRRCGNVPLRRFSPKWERPHYVVRTCVQNKHFLNVSKYPLPFWFKVTQLNNSAILQRKKKRKERIFFFFGWSLTVDKTARHAFVAFSHAGFFLTYMKWMNHWHRRDRAPNWSHAIIKLIFHFVRADDGPIGSVIEHLSVGLFGTRCGLNRKKVGIKKLYLIRFRCTYQCCRG